jgi:hypothetical protein
MPFMPEEIINPKKKTRSLINLPEREDRPVLGISLALALFFWLLVKLSTTYRTEKEVVLSFSLPEGKAFSMSPPKAVSCTVEGTGWALLFDYISQKETRLKVDIPPDTKRFLLSVNRLRTEINAMLLNIQVQDILFDNRELTLEDKQTIRVPVKVPLRLNFAQDYQLSAPPTLLPDTLTLTGPATALSKISAVYTDTLVLKGLSADTKKNMPLQTLPNGISSTVNTVSVQLSVEQFSGKSFWIPISIINCTDSVRIFPRSVLLDVNLGLSQYDAIQAEDFEVVADFKDAFANKGDRNSVLLRLNKSPDAARNITFSPKSIEYYLIKPDK